VSNDEAFCKHMAKVYISQAISFRIRSKGAAIKAKSWHSFLLNVCGKNRRQYLSYLKRDRKPVFELGQLDLFA